MKTTTLFVTSIVGILALTPDSFSNRLSTAEGRFGQALDARVYDVQVPHDRALTDWPVTVSVWVRMVDAS